MESLRAQARRQLREIIGLIAPRLDLGGRIDALIDTVIAAAVDETMRKIAHKLATGDD